MLEVVKILLESLLKVFSIETIGQLKKKKKLNEIGIELFIIYSNLNNILVEGRKIIAEIEEAIPYMKRKVEEKQPSKVPYFLHLTFRLQQQFLHLKQFSYAYERMQNVLEVLNPEFKVNLLPILDNKLGVLNQLAFAISLNSEDKTRFVSIDEDILQKLIYMSEEDFYNCYESSYCEKDGILNKLIVEEGIDDTNNIKSDLYPIFEEYIKSEKLKSQLDEIQRFALLLRDILEKNFSISDIILSVGDKRFLSIRY